ncbi:MAG: thiamine phosphate synthase [Candidatus Sumerlaeota bacterium]
MAFDKRLRLIAITERRRCGGTEQLLSQCRALLEAGLPCLMLREKDLDSRQLLELATTLRTLTHKHDALLIINNNIEVARACNADGVHLSFNAFLDFTESERSGLFCGVSCHSREELLSAERHHADYAFLSPVHAPLSKAHRGEPIGVDGFAMAVEGISIPVIALGGIEPHHIAALVSRGAAGVATIGGVFGGANPATALADYVEAICRA